MKPDNPQGVCMFLHAMPLPQLGLQGTSMSELLQPPCHLDAQKASWC